MPMQSQPEVRRLRDALDIAHEEIRQLRALMVPQRRMRLRGLSLTLAEQAIVFALMSSQDEVPASRLRQAIDITLSRLESGTDQAVKVATSRLRAKLRAVEPPIELRTVYGVGLWITEENRSRLQDRWENPR